MYITNLYLERFCERSDLRVDGLAEGLNIVFAPPGTGKTTVVQFLQTMFGGFDFSLRDRFVTRGWGGSVALQIDRRSYTVGRYDDGGRDERLTVERPDEAVVERRHVHRLLSDLNHALLRHAMVVDFNRRPELPELLREIASCGFLPAVEPQRTDKNAVRDGNLVEAEQHLSELRHEIANIEQTLSDLGLRRQKLQAQQKDAPPQSVRIDERPADLKQVEVQLRRWKRTLRDLLHYKKRAAEKYAARHVSDIDQSASSVSTLLATVDNVHKHVHQSLDRSETHETQSDSPRHVRQQLAAVVDQLGTDATRVAHAIDQERVRQDLHDALVERDQFARCESELRRTIRWLSWRRRSLLEHGSSESAPRHKNFTQAFASSTENHSTKNPLVQESNALSREINRLAEVRLKWLAEVDEWELDMAERRPKTDPISESWTPIVRDASEFLRRLTGHDDVVIKVSDRLEASIESQSGSQTRYEQLERGMRDQLYLAFCLAIAMANQRWGRQIPLVLNGVFTHYPSQRVRHALEFLMEFSRGQQLVCLTRHEHVVSVARLLNIPVRSVSSNESAIVDVSQRDESWASTSTVPKTRSERNRIASTNVNAVLWAADELAQRVGRVSHRSTTDLLDAANMLEGSARAFDTQAVASASEPMTIGGNGYCLGEHDPIEMTPSLDPINAQRLRKIGLLRVGDLLRVPTTDVAHDLRHTGVSADMIESWRAQARLMCSVPGLRTYDARILVACGIRDPEQLIQMHPGALRSRVKEFASSAGGQAILMSGTEFELSRVIDWISTAREIHDSTESAEAAKAIAQQGAQRRESRRRERRKVSGSATSLPRPVSSPSKSQLKANLAQRTYDAALHPHYIRLTDSVAAIPWLGTAVVRRLQKSGVNTVASFLETSSELMADKLRLSRVRPETLQRWQSQLRLVCAIPHLRFQDARLLFALGIDSIESLAACVPADLWQKVTNFCQSPKGRRLLGSCRVAEQDQIVAWVHSARQYHPKRAA